MKAINKIFKISLVFLIVSMSLFCVGCSEKQNEVVAILHAGGAYNGLTYLNAQETFDGYYNQGYRYFEYDLQLSSDGRIIGTHCWEYLNIQNSEMITYEEFKALKLSNGLTPVNEEWLMETIIAHPDVKIVVDAKMPTTEQDALVLQRLETLEKIYNCDISSNIIPEVFSKEMWDIVKETTTFDKYFFSHYKVYYSVNYILKNFDDERIYGIAFSIDSDSYFKSQIHLFKAAGKKIFIFTAVTEDDVAKAIKLGADGIYVDDVSIM